VNYCSCICSKPKVYSGCLFIFDATLLLVLTQISTAVRPMSSVGCCLLHIHVMTRRQTRISLSSCIPSHKQMPTVRVMSTAVDMRKKIATNSSQ